MCEFQMLDISRTVQPLWSEKQKVIVKITFCIGNVFGIENSERKFRTEVSKLGSLSGCNPAHYESSWSNQRTPSLPAFWNSEDFPSTRKEIDSIPARARRDDPIYALCLGSLSDTRCVISAPRLKLTDSRRKWETPRYIFLRRVPHRVFTTLTYRTRN